MTFFLLHKALLISYKFWYVTFLLSFLGDFFYWTHMLARNAWFNFQVFGCLLDMLLFSFLKKLTPVQSKNIFWKIPVTQILGIHFTSNIFSVMMHLPCTLEGMHILPWLIIVFCKGWLDQHLLPMFRSFISLQIFFWSSFSACYKKISNFYYGFLDFPL